MSSSQIRLVCYLGHLKVYLGAGRGRLVEEDHVSAKALVI